MTDILANESEWRWEDQDAADRYAVPDVWLEVRCPECAGAVSVPTRKAENEWQCYDCNADTTAIARVLEKSADA